MKKSMYCLTLAAIVAGATLSSCESKEKKVEDATAAVQTDKDNLKQAQSELNAEYPAYKIDAELRIEDNDKKITRLRTELSRPGNHPLDGARRKKIDQLQEANAELRIRLNEYETKHSDWQAFKDKYKKDMDALDQSLKDLDK